MTKSKKSFIIFATLALLLIATVQFLAADNSILDNTAQNVQLIEGNANRATANASQIGVVGSQLITTDDYLLEMSLVVIALLSLSVSLLIKKSIGNNLFAFQRHDHIDV